MFIQIKIKIILCEYIIWIDELNLSQLRATQHLFLDDTWYKSGDFAQILVIQYKVIIIKDYKTGGFIITNNKKCKLYIEILNSLKRLLTENYLNLESITSDYEKSMVKAKKSKYNNYSLFIDNINKEKYNFQNINIKNRNN